MSTVTLFDAARYNSDLKGIQLWNGWQISSSKNDDVIWNIVFAYLNSFSISDENELIQRMDLITGNGKVNRNFKNFLEKCNPFLHGEKMSDIIDEFKGRVEVDMKDEFQEESKNFRYLNASSKMLSCNIVLISSGAHGKTVITVFPVPLLGNPRTIFSNHILIINKFISVGENESQQENFSFCIPKEIGIERKRQALAEILKETRMVDSDEKMATEISLLPDITDHFLTSLLKNGFEKAVPFIYESPNVLSKLADAGFETDPRRKESAGKSAFFHALETEESQLGIGHPTNVRYETGSLGLSPNPEVFRNLLTIKYHLQVAIDCLESKDISSYPRALSLFRDLHRFNEFQIEIFKKINSMRNKIDPFDHTEEEFDLLQRIEKMLLIIDTYCNFDSIDVESSKNADEILRFKEFYEHKDYFDKLDVSTVLMFFDNFILLKERLQLPSKVYLAIESSFFLFICCRDYLKRFEKNESYNLFTRWIAFQERLTLKTQLCRFKKILESAKLPNGNIGGDLQEMAVGNSTNLTEMYRRFTLLRLRRYLSVALWQRDNEDFKLTLVIERCLQVFGECCNEYDFDSVENIMSLALPNDCRRNLIKIRQFLSNINPHKLTFRNELEQDLYLFDNIQNELVVLRKFLFAIYSASEYEMGKFLLSHFAETVDKSWRRSIFEGHEDQMITMEILKSLVAGPVISWTVYFDYLYKEMVCFKQNTLDEYLTPVDKNVVKNLIFSVSQLFGNRNNWKHKEYLKTVKTLDSRFLCLENFLNYITTDVSLAENHKELKVVLEERKRLFTSEFRRYLKSQDESICKISQQTGNPIHSFEKHGVVVDKDTSDVSCSNEYSLKKTESSETNQVKNEFNLVNLENSILRDISVDIKDILQERICAKEYDKFSSGLQEISEKNIQTSEADGVNNDSLLQSESKCQTMGFKKEAEKFLHRYEVIVETLFQKFPKDSNEDFEFKNIEKVCLMLKGSPFLKYEEKEIIRQSVPKKLKNVPHVKESLKRLLEEKIRCTEEIKAAISELNRKTKGMIASNKIKKKEDDDIHMVDSARDYFLELKVMMESKVVDKDYCELLCKKLEIPDKAKNILMKLVPKQDEKVPSNQYLTNEEKELITQCVSDRYQNVPEHKLKVKALLRRETELIKEIEYDLNTLNLKSEEFQEVRKIINFRLIDTDNVDHIFDIINSATDYFSNLNLAIESHKISKSEYKSFCDNLRLSGEAKNILSKLATGRNKKGLGNEFEFLRTRIKMLKKILIGENSVSFRKINEKEKIVQTYFKDSTIQASVEILLSDCMSVLCSKELENISKKTTYPFNSVNLRKVLTDGQPFLESSERLLDPCDLASELVEKMLLLISDEHVLDCMQQILEQSGTNFSGFMQIMSDDKDEHFKNLREEILECEHWKKYALQIPFHKKGM